MLTLHELQKGFRASLFGSGSAAILEAIVSDEIAAHDRLSVYRNTACTVLINSLRLTYPAVARLIGQDFFDMAAARFIKSCLPASGCLNDYGAAFPAFLEAMPEAADVPYLGDVGRYEWALSLAAHAPDVGTIDLMALASLDPERHQMLAFIPHPSVSLLELAFPADTIADAVIAEDAVAMAHIDLSSGPVRLIVHRDADGIQVERLQQPVHRFLQALFKGHSLKALTAYTDVDVTRCLAAQFTKSRIAGFMDCSAGSMGGLP
ncbi:MAG TPA: DNA-binding domain-containing protein [Rhodopila sp.]|nr:DNA-binding domain-containing protein [Rhodopila sp.]